MNNSNSLQTPILTGVIGAFIGALILYLFFWPEFETKTEIVEVSTTDTVFVSVIDTVHINRTQIKHEYLRDTILIEQTKPTINTFKTSTPFLYGNTYISGEVLGAVLKMDVTNDFNIPLVTNTITTTKTNTIIKKPTGLYVTVGVTKQLGFEPSIGVTLVRPKMLIGVSNTDVKFGWKLGK